MAYCPDPAIVFAAGSKTQNGRIINNQIIVIKRGKLFLEYGPNLRFTRIVTIDIIADRIEKIAVIIIAINSFELIKKLTFSKRILDFFKQ